MAKRIFDDMVSELQFDTILKARQDADKAKRLCRCCGTHCSLPHTPGASVSVNPSTTHLTVGQQPASQNKNSVSSSSGSGTPTKDNGNILLICPVCKRQFASNRIAAHLATCMGISTGSRRGARSAKAKMDERPGSPYVDLPDEVVSGSQKAKSKKKDSNGNGKRPPSPSVIDTPTKKLKKQKIGSFNESADNVSVSSSQPPSSLRKSSTSSIANGFASDSASQYSGEPSPMSTSSSHSTQGQASAKKVKAKAPSVSAPITPLAASRGPPGSSKGRAIATARLFGEGDVAMAEP